MLKILVVDDEESVREMVSGMIASSGYDVVVAENGVQAMVACDDTEIDLIITDIVMPEKNGIDFIMDVRKKYPDIPIIAISGGGGITGRYDYLEIATLIGAHNVLKKPFSLHELRVAVTSALA